MKNISKMLFSLSVFALSACSFGGSPDVPNEKNMSKEEITAAWEKSMELAEEHKILSEMTGSWKASVKFWTQPGSAPNVSVAKSINKTILNGKFLVEDYSGSFGGQAFKGMSVMGYDTILQKFSNFWADNMGTGAIYSEGTIDKANRSINFTGAATDPITKTKKPTFSVIKVIDNDRHTLEMFDVLPDGKKFKTLEIDYKRSVTKE